MNSSPIVLGLVGKPCSGKDTVGAYLTERYGFVHISTGDLVRFYIAEHQLGELTRPLLQQVANVLRAEHGPDYLVRLALTDRPPRLVLSGLRALAEVAALKEVGKAIAITAPIDLRFHRMQGRGRISDHLTFEQFKEQEEIEDTNVSENAQNVLAALALADYTVHNNGDLEHLQEQLDSILTTLTRE